MHDVRNDRLYRQPDKRNMMLQSAFGQGVGCIAFLNLMHRMVVMLDSAPLVPTLLAAGQSLRILDGEGTLIQSLDGNIWITQAGDVRDVILRAGQSFSLDRNGLALLVALEQPAMAVIIEPHKDEALPAPVVCSDFCPSLVDRQAAHALGV